MLRKEFVNATNSSTLSFSGRISNTGFAVNEANVSASHPSRAALSEMTFFREFLNVFLLCPKEVLTMFLNAFHRNPVISGISGQPYHCRLHFRRRSECARTHSEQVLDVIPGLKQDGQDAVSLGTRLSAILSATSFCIMQTVWGIRLR